MNKIIMAKPAQLALAISAALTTFAHAEEVKELSVSQAKTQTQESYKVDQSSNYKYSQPLLDTAKTMTVINQAVMKDRNVDSLRDALRNVSGISFAAGEGGAPTGDSMSIRGFSARTDISVDGIRDIAGYDRDMYNTESVEVAKGPGSAVSGRGSAGGNINLVTKTATLDTFTDVSLRVGSEGDYRSKLDSNTTLGETTALRINLLADDGDVAGRDEVNNSNYAGAISVATGLGTTSRFTLNADIQKQENLPDYGLPWVSNSATSDPVAELAEFEGKAPPANFDNFYGNVYRDYEDIDASSVTAKYEFDFNNNTLIRTQARVGSVERESIVTAPRFISLTTSTDVRLSDEKTRDTKDSLAALQIDMIGEYTLGSTTHNVVTGIELTNETFKRWNLTDVVDDNLDSTPELNDLYHPDPFITYTGRYERDDTHIEAKGKNKAIYIFDNITLNDKWELSAGLRYDEFEVDYQYSYTDPTQKVETTDYMLSWNLAGVYKPSVNSSIYFGAGNSFNPSAETLTLSSRGMDSLASLDPEETTSYELGAKWSLLNGQLSTNAALFQSTKDNVRNRIDPNTYELGGEQRVKGVELSVTGQITQDWLAIASYTYQHSEVLKESEYFSTPDAVGTTYSLGNELANTPDHSFSLWTKYQINEQFSAGFGAQYLAERFNSSDITSRETAESYTIYDLLVTYQATEQLSVQFNGENLTDENYIDQLGGGHFVPGQGRYFSLTGQYTF